jgi:hypothetical protein
VSGLRVAYVGNFKPSHSTETHLARTLTQMGHTVARLQEDDLTPNALMAALHRMDRPDMFLFTRTWGATVTADHLSWLRVQGIPSVSYHLDFYVGLARGGAGDPKSSVNIGLDPFWTTDWVFSADGDPLSQEFFERKGIRHRWLPPGVVADECYISAERKLSYDVVFVGSRRYHQEWGYRPELIGWLERTYGPMFRWFGRPGEPVRGYSLNALYGSTRVVVGDSCNPGYKHSRYWSDRIPETLGRGGFLVHPRVEGMVDEGFVGGDTLCTYKFGDFDGLKDRIDHYLTHDAEREQIRRAGHEHVKAHHTYTHRLSQMLDMLRAEGAL